MTNIKTPATISELEAILNSEDSREVTINLDGTVTATHPPTLHPRRQSPVPSGSTHGPNWPDPTPEMLRDPQFEAVWQLIKSWDINVPEVYGGYCHATGNHVRAILDALSTTRMPEYNGGDTPPI